MAESGWGPYRRGWRTAVLVLAALGLVTAVVFVGWSTNVVAFLMGGTLVAAIYLSVGLAQERQPSELVRDVLRWGTRAGLCVVAIVGYATAIGMGTLWLLLLIAVTSPALVSWLWPARGPVRRPQTTTRPQADEKPQPDQTTKTDQPPKAERKPKPDEKAERKPKPDQKAERKAEPDQKAERKPKVERKAKVERRAKKQPPPEPPPPEQEAPKVPEPVNVADLSEEELCLAWRRSFTELQSCTTDEQRLAVITARNAYLDELERRAPDAFAQWLDSGPRAAGNPARFFSPRTNHGDPD